MAKSGNPAKRAGTPAATHPMAILWSSNSPHAATGYGQQTEQVVTRLAAAGHKVAIASNYGLEGTITEWRGIKHFPRGFDLYSNDVVPAHMMAWAHENPGLDPLVITLFDVWVYKGQQWDLLNKVASWVPIDHTPAPPDVVAWCKRPNVTPIAMSQFGKSMLEREGIEALYVPHAIDTSIFKPTEKFTAGDKRMTGREFMEVPSDAWVVGINSANKGGRQGLNRKAFPEMFLAFGMWAKKRTDAVLYVHTEDRGAMGGINLKDLAQACGIREQQIKFVDQYAYRSGIPKEVLAAVYSGMDTFYQVSLGEGFGIPAIEALACGVPVILNNATSQTELCGDGWLTENQPTWDDAQRSWWHTPTVSSIIEALEAAYQRGPGVSAEAVKFAKDYDADKVFANYWVPALEVLA